jgi:TolC family type I secretion outer membrane protein
LVLDSLAFGRLPFGRSRFAGGSLAGAIGLALAAMLPAAAQAQSLEDALVSTYLSNPELRGQRAALRATDELVPQALSDWRPTLRANTSATVADIESSSGGGTLDTIDNALTLEQNLYRGGETVANTRRAELLVRLERANLRAIEQDTLLDAVSAYTGLLSDLAVLELATQNVSRLRRQRQATGDRFEVGEVTRTDVAQSEASLAGARTEQVRAGGQIEASRATFRNVIDLEPVSLTPPPPIADLPATEAEAQQIAESMNPNILAAQFNLAAAKEEVNIARSALYPTLSVTGELTYTDEPSLSVAWQRAASIGANLSVPLYQGGGEYARVRQTKQTVRQRQEDLDATYRAVREEVTAAWQLLVTNRTRIDSIAEQVRAAEIALEGSRQEALVGQRTTLDVLDQENDLFQAEVDLVSAQRDEIVASYRLKAAIGQLSAADIGLAVEPYDAEEYYEDVRSRLIGLGEDPGDERHQ